MNFFGGASNPEKEYEAARLQHHVEGDAHHAIMNERKADADKVPGDSMIRDLAHELFHNVSLIAKDMGEMVALVVWNEEYEVLSALTPGCNAFFVKTARGKIVSLMDHKDYNKMSTSALSIMPQMAALAAGATNRFDVKGAILAKYEYPLGSGQEVFGCASVSGCMDANNDYKILHMAMDNCGFKFGEDLIGRHPPPAMATIEDTVRFRYIMARYHVDAKGATEILEAKKGDAAQVADDIHMKKVADKCLEYTRELAAEMKEQVALVIWHEKLEVFSGTVTDDTNSIFITTARAKITSLSTHKDPNQMTGSPFLVPGRAAAFFGGFTTGMGVAGAVMVRYEYPQGSGEQVYDYVSVSGCIDANNDLRICKYAVGKLGLVEGPDGVYAMPRGAKNLAALGVEIEKKEERGGRCSDRCASCNIM